MSKDGMGLAEQLDIYMSGKINPKHTDLIIQPRKKEIVKYEKGVAYHDNRNNH